jgi:hypothetical protein
MRNWIFLLIAAGAMPVPPPEMEQLRPFLAAAICSGQVEDSPFGPGHPTQGQMQAALAAGGFWVQVRYQEKKTRDNPQAVSAEERWSYDPALKKFVALLWDGYGGYGTGSSPGWEGDSFVWTGEVAMNGQRVPYRQTFTREQGGAIAETWEMQLNGAWAKINSSSCKRRGK